MENHGPNEPRLDGPSPEKTGGRVGQNYFTSPEEFTEAAQEYFANGFPNPERIGCPPFDAIWEVVRSGQIPTAELRVHLFGCSECFCEYREAVLRQRQLAVAPTSWWRDLIAALPQWSTPLLAGAVVLLVLGIGIFIWNSRKEPAPQISQSRPQLVPSADVERRAATGSDKTSPVSPMPQARTIKPSVAGSVEQKSRPADLLAFNIDLNDYPQSEGPRRREAGREKEKEIKLPRARVRLDLKLPSASLPGRYRVTIVDDYLRPIVAGQSLSQDGNRLNVNLDLSRLTKRFYRLRLSQGDEVPDFYQVVITTP